MNFPALPDRPPAIGENAAYGRRDQGIAAASVQGYGLPSEQIC